MPKPKKTKASTSHITKKINNLSICDIWLESNKTTSFFVEKVKSVNERQVKDQPDISLTQKNTPKNF